MTEPSPTGMSIQTTTNLAFAGSGLLDVAVYLQQCWQAGHFVVPSTELISLGLCALLPLGHAIYRGVMNRVNRWADGPAKEGKSA